MTLDKLDQKLASWKQDLPNINANLVSLEDGGGYVTAKANQLTGETDTKCHEAFTTVEKLWEYLKLIRDVVEEAQKKRDNLPRLIGRQEAIDEIDKLLNGQSIQLSLVVVPAHERGLLGSATQKQTTTPDELKKTMVEVFDKANKFFVNLRQRWLDLAEVASRRRAEVEQLEARVNTVGKPKPAELSDIEARLTTFDRTRLGNPLSLQPKKFDEEIGGYITKARIVIQKMEHDRESIGEDVKRAYARLEQVRGFRVQALEAQKKVDDTLKGMTLEQPPKTKDLVDQLEVIKAALTAKKFAEVESGLDSWNREAQRLEDLYKQTAREMEELLRKADGLKTRMDAAKKKRVDNADKGLNSDKALDAFQKKFDEASGDKLDFNAAEMAVTSYETRLEGLIVAWEHAPADVRLQRRLDKAKDEAETLGFANQKSLMNFAKAAEDAIKNGKLDTAEGFINSYEVKLGEFKVNPPKVVAAPAETTHKEDATGSTTAQPAPPAVDPKTALNDRLTQAKAKAVAAGHGEDKALGKFAEKADELIGKGDLDGAERMVHSYETRQAELAAKPHAETVAEDAPGQHTAPAVPTKDSLQKRLTDAQARAAQNAIAPGKALTAFAQKAEEALEAGDLQKAEDMILSYETRLSELLAHGQS
jgi:uncharacterized coiled-coil DUF342 family protein/ribosomal protein S20